MGCCLTPMIFMALCVLMVILAFSCTMRLPNQGAIAQGALNYGMVEEEQHSG